MTGNIPPLPPGEPPSDGRTELLELELLAKESELLRLVKREAGQRFALRWIAPVVGVLVMTGMALLLTHVVHHMFWGPFVMTSPAVAVALIVAPITSITAISVALFVGAFRKFDDKDLDGIGSGVATGIGLARSGS